MKKLTVFPLFFFCISTGLFACTLTPLTHPIKPVQTSQSVTAQLSPSPSPTATPQVNYLEQAISKAARAARMSKEASSKDDWTLIANQYQQSITLLRKIQKSDTDYAKAQAKLKEYQPLLASAQAKQNRPIETAAIDPRPVQHSAPAIAQSAPMTARQFLEAVYFPQVIDQGYSGESLWCAEYEILASSLFAPRSYEILSISENNRGASAIARIESSNRGGQPIINNWSFYLNKGATTGEREYRKQNSPVSAQAWRNSVGGWCISLISEQ